MSKKCELKKEEDKGTVHLINPTWIVLVDSYFGTFNKCLSLSASAFLSFILLFLSLSF
jgi:hypothetical protein